MNREQLDRLLDIARRQELAPEELRRLEEEWARDPSQRVICEDEIRLTRLLRTLADAPLSPDFTPRVLRAVSEPASVPWAWGGSRWGWLPRHAIQLGAAAALAVVLALAYSHQHSINRARMAASLVDISRGVEAASHLTRMPTVEVLLDFEPIHYLSQTTPLADEELLNALQ